jgi:hypothetical protein
VRESRRSKSSGEAVGSALSGRDEVGTKSVHSAGTIDLLPSGRISTNCNRPCRCVRCMTSSVLPSNG